MSKVINGMPRKLRSVLRMILSALDRDAAEGKTVRGEMAEELRRILSTAQPADHSEHDLNMVSQPAADGERDVPKLCMGCVEQSSRIRELEHKMDYYKALESHQAASVGGEREAFEAEIREHREDADLSRKPDGSYSNYYLECVWQRFQMGATNPQQVVAVTDEVRRLREALEVCVEVIERFSYRWDGQGKHPQMALNGAKAALSAHKTGEEE